MDAGEASESTVEDRPCVVEQEVVSVHDHNYEWVGIQELLEVGDVLGLFMQECRDPVPAADVDLASILHMAMGFRRWRMTES